MIRANIDIGKELARLFYSRNAKVYILAHCENKSAAAIT